MTVLLSIEGCGEPPLPRSGMERSALTAINYPVGGTVEYDLYQALDVRGAWARGVSGRGQHLLVLGQDAFFVTPTNSTNLTNSFRVWQECRTFLTIDHVDFPWMPPAQVIGTGLPHDSYVAAIAGGSDLGSITRSASEFAGIAFDGALSYGGIAVPPNPCGGFPGYGFEFRFALQQLGALGGSHIIGTGVSFPVNESEADVMIQQVTAAAASGHVVVPPAILFDASSIDSPLNTAKLPALDAAGAIIVGTVPLPVPSPAPPAHANVSVYVAAPNAFYSVATPAVMGVIALMRQANPALTWDQIKLLLGSNFGTPSSPLNAPRAVELAQQMLPGCSSTNACWLTGAGRTTDGLAGTTVDLPVQCASEGSTGTSLSGATQVCRNGRWTSSCDSISDLPSCNNAGCAWYACANACRDHGTDICSVCPGYPGCGNASCSDQTTLPDCNDAGCAWYACADACRDPGTDICSVCPGYPGCGNASCSDQATLPDCNDAGCAWYACANACRDRGTDICAVCSDYPGCGADH